MGYLSLPQEVQQQIERPKSFITEAQLREMDKNRLTELCIEAGVVIPQGLETQEQIVDWLLENFS